jgi:ribosomal RNA assembly protein
MEQEEFSYELKIPKERIAVLIGKKGQIKKEIEEATRSKMKVDSQEGDIFIKGKDPLGMFSAREIILAIGRGFNPDLAMYLLKQDYCFDMINIADYAGKTKNKMIRLRGRVIGEEGKSRKNIEQLTETNISVYGKTIGIIGQPQNVSNARKAIESLLSGSKHATVYRWLEKKRKELKMSEFFDTPIPLKE